MNRYIAVSLIWEFRSPNWNKAVAKTQSQAKQHSGTSVHRLIQSLHSKCNPGMSVYMVLTLTRHSHLSTSMSNVSTTFPDMLASSDVQVAYKMMRPLHIIDIIFLCILNHLALLIMPYKATELQLVIRQHYLKKNDRKKSGYA